MNIINENNDDEEDPLRMLLYMMKGLLILNAVENGWSVKKIGTNAFEFKKKHEDMQDLLTEGELFRFLINNLQRQIEQ